MSHRSHQTVFRGRPANTDTLGHLDLASLFQCHLSISLLLLYRPSLMLIPFEPLGLRVFLRLDIRALGITLLVILATKVRFGGALAPFLLFLRGIVLGVAFT